MAETELPDLYELWNYAEPAETAVRFRELLPAARASGDTGYYLELMTQIARTQGLQRHFDEAHATLDEVEAQLEPEFPIARIRYLLERGRTYNSSGRAEAAMPLFMEAYELGTAVGSRADDFTIDALHMIAIAAPDEEKLNWNLKALQLTEATLNPRASRWAGSLYNNIGWTYHDQGDYDRALDMFEKALTWYGDNRQDSPELIRIGKWCVARCYRSLGRVDEALNMQLALLAEHEAAGNDAGFVYEELGECYHLLERHDQARHYFGLAYEALAQDDWLAAEEPERLRRLKQLAKAE